MKKMEKKKSNKMKIIQIIWGLLLISSFVFFVIGEIFLPAENISKEGKVSIFEADWMQVKPDGTKIVIEVPGNCEAELGEWVTIMTTLPAEQKDTWFCIRSMQQDMNIYVGDELRESFSTLDTQMFGKTSTISYVFFQIHTEDAGKALSISFMSESSYAGYVGEIYEGDKYDIARNFFEIYAPSTIVAMFMLMLSILVVAGCLFVKIFYRTNVELIYLGSGMLIASTWMIAESRLRQFMFSNSSMAVVMGFLMIALVPYPFLLYINSIQKQRYHKAYMVVSASIIVNYLVVLALQIMNIKDFFETMLSSHIIIVAAILLMGSTILIDVLKGYAREYREVAMGFALFMLAGVCELVLVYVAGTKINGIALCVGLVVLLVSAGFKAIRDLFNIEKEKQIAVAASESKAQFLANMSHEIRTPINVVIGMNEMILRENNDKVIEEYAHNIKNASQMLLSLVNDVLDFSKIEAGKLKIVEADYKPESMLKDVIKGIEIRAEQKNLEIKSDIDETIPKVLKGDEVRIKQILNNLLSNAVKYTEKGSITISAKGVCEEDRFYLLMSVEDTGRGIKKEDVGKLFDSFQRLELKKNRYIEGTGLGLNITKQLVEGMNGTIEVKSEYGVGSCFSVKLPQQIVDALPADGQEENIMEKTELYAPDAKVLVVDDTPMNLKIIKGLLKKSQMQLDLASGGNECLQLTKEKKYDLILMDAMMPDPDGVQTLHLIREDESNPNQNTEIIVLTADAIAGVKEQYIKEGFSDYIPKPINPDVLEAAIARFLQ